MNTKNPRDIHGDGHGFRAVSQGGPKSGATPNAPGIYRVEVYDLAGRRFRTHHDDGTYDERRGALNAVIDACCDNTVGHVEFINQCEPRTYSYNYDLRQAPTDQTRILGLYQLSAPGTEQGWVYHTRMIWLAVNPIKGLRYLTDERNDAPYYIPDPLAWSETPKP